MGFVSLMVRADGLRVVIAGGGNVAFRKACLLEKEGASIKVIAPEVCGRFNSLKCKVERRLFNLNDIRGAHLVVAATSCRKTNSEIAAAARREGIPVNVADCIEESGVIFPASTGKGGIRISVSTFGRYPYLAKKIKNKLEKVYARYDERFLKRIEARRRQIPEGESASERRLRIENILSEELFTCKAEGEEGNGRTQNTRMRVILAGAGIGSAEFITIKAARALKKADIIIYDSLMDKALLKLAKPKAELIFAGKRRGKHSITQDKLNELLYEKAKSGKLVMRLKGGDPFIFGQGKEEFLYLTARGVEVKVIPGLTSAVAAPAFAGISLTDRVSLRCFTVLTGSFKDGKCNYDWKSLKSLGGAKVFLMGLENAKHIADCMMNAGCPSAEPACIIENACSREQRFFNCTLNTLYSVCIENEIKPPAVIVIGAQSFFPPHRKY